MKRKRIKPETNGELEETSMQPSIAVWVTLYPPTL